jgi:hypothetical protein
MLCLLVISMLSQPHPPTVSAKAAGEAWAPPVSWVEHSVTKHASVSLELVAEPSPSSATAEALTAFDPLARVVFDGPRMRLWRVTSPSQALAQLAQLLPVLHDLPSTASRVRVPLGVVCPHPTATQVRGLEVFTYLQPHPDCLPNFWYRPSTK